MFAKFLFLATTAFLPLGNDLAWPLYSPVVQDGAFVISYSPPPPTGDSPPQPRPVQYVCVQAPGVYVLGFHLGVKPLTGGILAVGEVMAHAPGGEEVVLAHFRVTPLAGAVMSSSTAISMPQAGCMTLTYTLAGYGRNGGVTLETDPAVTRLTVHRAAS